MATAVYVRVSHKSQDTKSQEMELRTWAKSQEGEIVWYRDHFTGTEMERPGLDRLLADVRCGKVTRIVCWRLDRLGRTAKGLVRMSEFFVRHGCLEPAAFRVIYERHKARWAAARREGGEQEVSLECCEEKGREKLLSLLIELYEASFATNQEPLRQRMQDLEEQHRRLVIDCRKLPEGSRALGQLHKEMLGVEASMTQIEADMTNLTAAVQEAMVEVARTRERLADARKSISADIGLRAKAERLRQVIDRIVVRFEPTGRKYPKSKALEIEIVPKVGGAVKYRTDALLYTAPAPPSRRSGGRPPPPGP
jgi:hypothetical protein